jgi:hypothetical protein
MNSVLCNQGYIISKKTISKNQIQKIKTDLKVKPFIQGSRSRFAKSFKIYLENEDKFSIPKFYGISNFGKPTLEDFTKGEDINLNFNGSLRDYQINVIKTVLPKIKNQEGGTISLPPGRGKTVIACKLISD